LRQPMEDGIVMVSRASSSMQFPAKFMLVAAQNPCPCGYLGDPTHECRCSISEISRYQKRLSGPLLDRIDLHIEVPAVKMVQLVADTGGRENSKSIRERVGKARDIQTRRFKGLKILTNAEMGTKDIKKFANLDEEAFKLLKTAIVQMKLSARGYTKVIKVARTIADLAASVKVSSPHIAEALSYRFREDN